MNKLNQQRIIILRTDLDSDYTNCFADDDDDDDYYINTLKR